MDDMVLSVRQIAQYPNGQAGPLDWVVVQSRGIGGPYYSSTLQDLIAGATDQPAPSSLLGGSNVTQLLTGVVSLTGLGAGETGTGDPAIGFNARWDAGFNGRRFTGGPASLIWSDQQSGKLWFQFFASGAADGLLENQQIAAIAMAPDGSISAKRLLLAGQGQSDADAVTVGWINRQAVRSFNGRFGAIRLNRDDILLAGGAASYNAELEGQPLAPTADGSCKHQVANVECVEMRVAEWINGLINEHPFCFTFNDRRGDIWLRASDITEASFRDPDEPPEVPTAPDGTATDQIASTAFVSQGLQDLQDWVEEELATSGDVTMAYLQANYAPLASPQLSGNPTAPTAAPGNATGQIATTGFVMNAVAASTAGVASFNNRTGHVDLELADLTDAGGAPLASPTFTGSPRAPTPSGGDSSTLLATTAFVMTNSVASFNTRTGAVTLTLADITAAGGAPSASPFFTGSPQAPTVPPGTNNQQLATTAFVMAEVAASTAGVASWNGRTGNVSLQANDISAVGGALTASPSFSGVPAAPTAAPGTSTTQIATTAFVQAAMGSGVTSFNGRTGTVNLTNSDVVAVTGPLAAPGSAPPNMDGVANAGISAAYSRQDHIHPSDTAKANLAGAIFTGAVVTNSSFTAQGAIQINGGGQVYSTAMTPGGSGPGLLELYNVALRSSSYIGNLGAISPNCFGAQPSYIWGAGSWSNFSGGGAHFFRVDTTAPYLAGFLYGNATLVGSITTNGTSVSFNNTSDGRLKENVRDLAEALDPGEVIDAMRPVAFDWKERTGVVDEPGKCLFTGPKDERISYPPLAKGTREGHGFIAQELIKVAPHAVHAPNDGTGRLQDFETVAKAKSLAGEPWGVDFAKLVPYLVAELQSVRRRLEALEA